MRPRIALGPENGSIRPDVLTMLGDPPPPAGELGILDGREDSDKVKGVIIHHHHHRSRAKNSPSGEER